MFAIVGYESFYFLFNKKLTLLKFLLINLLVFYVAILLSVTTIILAKLFSDILIHCKILKEFIYYFFFLKLNDLGGFNELVVFILKNLYIVFFLIVFSFLFSSLQYNYIKDENNSSDDVYSQISGFFDLFFKYLVILSILLFIVLVYFKF